MITFIHYVESDFGTETVKKRHILDNVSKTIYFTHNGNGLICLMFYSPCFSR